MANRRFIDFPIASTVGENDIVLIWQSGANKQTTKGTLLSGVAKQLNDLTDVTITSLANGQILQYDSVTGQWINVDRTDIDLSELGDVSIISPANGQVLVYNSATAKWENSSGGYVPYVGAVTTVDLGLQGLEAGFIRLDTSITSPPTGQGTMYWDQDEETVAIILNGSTTKVGEDIFFQVKNQSGATIPKGTAVRFDGVVGASDRVKIVPFLANGSNPSIYFLGVTYENIADGADGKALFNGKIRGVNTSAFAVGDILYASPTVAGGFTTTKPVAPNNIISVAAVLSSGVNGILLVRPQIGSNINNDEGVKITTPTIGDLLQLQASGLWENKSVASLSLVPQSRTLTINGTAFDLSANRSWSIPVHDSVTLGTVNGLSLSGQVLSLGLASASANGALSSTDWNTFNNKIGGSGTTNYLAKFTAGGTVGDSQIFDNGTNVVIGSGIQSIPTNAKLTLRNGLSFVGLDFKSQRTIGNIGGTRFFNTSNDTIPVAEMVVEVDGKFVFYNGSTLTSRFTIEQSGASIFSNSLTVVGNIQTQDSVVIGSGIQSINSNAKLTLRNGLSFVGLDFKSQRTIGNIGGTRFFNTSNDTIPVAEMVVEVDGKFVFYNGSTLTSRFTIEQSGASIFSNSLTVVGNIQTKDSSALNLGYNQGGGAALKYNANGNLDITPRSGFNTVFTGGNVLINTPTDAGFRLDVNGSLRANTRVNFASLPTSATGLVSGDLWRNGTVINIVA